VAASIHLHPKLYRNDKANLLFDFADHDVHIGICAAETWKTPRLVVGIVNQMRWGCLYAFNRYLRANHYSLVNIQMPNGCIGKVIEELMK
jgi:hypothetical protein